MAKRRNSWFAMVAISNAEIREMISISINARTSPIDSYSSNDYPPPPPPPIKRLTTENQDTMDFLAISRSYPAIISPDPSEMLELNNSAVLFYYVPNAGFSTAGNQFAPPFRRNSHSPIRSGPHGISSGRPCLCFILCLG